MRGDPWSVPRLRGRVGRNLEAQSAHARTRLFRTSQREPKTDGDADPFRLRACSDLLLRMDVKMRFAID
jgi:hypothetical protein